MLLHAHEVICIYSFCGLKKRKSGRMYSKSLMRGEAGACRLRGAWSPLCQRRAALMALAAHPRQAPDPHTTPPPPPVATCPHLIPDVERNISLLRDSCSDRLHVTESHAPYPRDQSGAMQSGPSRWGSSALLKKGLTEYY